LARRASSIGRNSNRRSAIGFAEAVWMSACPGAVAATVRIAAFTLSLVSAHAQPGIAPVPPEPVTFPSADGRTTLIGYVYAAPNKGERRAPAVVMMHGRAGAYSSAANGRFDASTLSQRHQMWGRLWAQQGYVAVLVDGFGPRNYWNGFGRGTYSSRPDDVNEVTVRPLDAYGALVYLRTRSDVLADRIGLQGWSNGGSAALATMAPDAPGIGEHTPAAGFRAALAFYPACDLRRRFDAGLKPYAPVRILQGDADDEVSPRVCQRLVERSRAQAGDIELILYPGATHDFDDPGDKRQSVAANASAKADAMLRARQFFAEQLGGGRAGNGL
jgi:dienelactone hydrolase